MGDCKNCSCGSSCNKSTDTIQIKRTNRVDTKNESLFVKNEPKFKTNIKSLEDTCGHYPFGTINCFQCDECIKEFVNSYGIEESLKEVEIYKNKGKKIASERIGLAINELRRRMRIV